MLDILRKLHFKIENQKMELWVAEKENIFFYEHIGAEHTCLIAISPVGSTRNKNWLPSKYQDVINRIRTEHSHDVHFVILGDQRAVEAASCILEDIPHQIATNLAGKTNLMQAAAILKKSCLYIGSETGLMHMAAAVGVPVVDLSFALPGHTWSDVAIPERFGPWGVEYIALQPPHGLDNCAGVCTQKYPHCITQITVDEVVDASCRLLGWK